MDQYVNIWNIGSYDYVLPDSNPNGANYSGHCSNYSPQPKPFGNPHIAPFNTRDAVGYYSLTAGIDLSKIHLGIPLYATQFYDTDGLGQKCGTILYDSLDHLQAQPFIVENTIHDKPASAAYQYNGTSRILSSYECTDTVAYKANIVKDGALGGIAWIKASGQRDGGLIRHVSRFCTSRYRLLIRAIGCP